MPKPLRFGSFERFGWGQKREFIARSNRELYGGLPPGSDIGSAADRLGRRQLAEQMAGTTDRKSKAYRNARDYISRHIGGRRRTVRPDYEKKVTDALRTSRRAEITERGNLTVDIMADVKVSRRVWKRGRMKATLSGDSLEGYLSALDAENANGAMFIFLKEYDVNNQFPEAIAEIPTIHNITYT